MDALLGPLTSDAPGGPVGLTTPRILRVIPPSRVNTCGNTMHYTGLTGCQGVDQSPNVPALTRACAVTAVSGAYLALTHTLWEQLGGFDESFFTYLEAARKK
ncbi:MAG: hypothetical protein M3Z04_08250 [Chloroflexota bacterium]|nr:hypothetical protein [Chloroflexota bacterium]